MSKQDGRSLDNLKEPWFWTLTPLVRNAALEGMENRARNELCQVESGVDMATVHGETISRYTAQRHLITGALLFLRLTGYNPTGRAADLGSGTGVAACILSQLGRIDEIFAIDYSESFVAAVMPVVFNKFRANVDKIQRVVGDFNKLNFEDDFLDIIVALGSLHHSEALDLTLGEAWRVLRPGGSLIAIERAWPDGTSQEYLDARLNKQLPDGLKRKYGIPESANFTRCDWGEHEYTRSEWVAAFEEVGFHTILLMQRFPQIRGLNLLLKRLPTVYFSVLISSIAYRTGKRRLWMYGFRPRQILFVCIKKPNYRRPH